MSLFDLAAVLCSVLSATLLILMVPDQPLWARVILWPVMAYGSLFLATQLVFLSTISLKLKQMHAERKLPDPVLSVGIFSPLLIPVLSGFPVLVFSNLVSLTFLERIFATLIIWIFLLASFKLSRYLYARAFLKLAPSAERSSDAD